MTERQIRLNPLLTYILQGCHFKLLLKIAPETGGGVVAHDPRNFENLITSVFKSSADLLIRVMLISSLGLKFEIFLIFWYRVERLITVMSARVSTLRSASAMFSVPKIFRASALVAVLCTFYISSSSVTTKFGSSSLSSTKRIGFLPFSGR